MIQGRNIRNTFDSVNAVFSPSCISHTVITKPDWMKVEVAGVNLPDAIQCWVSTTLPGEEQDPRRVQDTLASDKYLYDEQQRAMMADSPARTAVAHRPINSNLVRSLDNRPTATGEVLGDKKGLAAASYANSIGRRITEVNQNLVDNRTQKELMRPPRPKLRHHHTQHPRCRYGDTLENRLRCIREENKLFQENAVAPGGGRNNRDLLRSLDSTRTRRRRRRRRNRNRQIRLAGAEDMTKEERRQRRREERRRLKESERKRRKARKREEKRRLRELEKIRRSEERRRRRREEERAERKSREEERAKRQSRERNEEEREGRKSREGKGRRSKRDAGTCSMKHIDRCSWPQCNRSCPQLHNPLTGIMLFFYIYVDSIIYFVSTDLSRLDYYIFSIEISSLFNFDQL